MNDLNLLIISLAFLVSLTGAAAAIWARSTLARKRLTPPATPIGKVGTWFYRPADLIGILMLFGFFSMTSYATMAHSDEMDMSHMSAASLLVGIAIQMMIPAAVIAFALRLINLDTWLGMRWKNWPLIFLIAPGTVAALALVYIGFQQLGYMTWLESLGVETKQDTVVLLESTQDYAVLGLMIILAVVVAPLWEEVVFRGYVYPVLKKYGGIWAGALCSSLFFAAIHNNIAALLPLFILALAMVWLYECTGSIWTPIAIHACFNALAVMGTMMVRNNGTAAATLGFPLIF